MRGGRTKLTHNSGWYNKSGEKLGWGDLSNKDMTRISRELKADEIFITLGEQDSHWQTTRRSVSESAPGVDYVIKYATYVIALRRLFRVTDWRPLAKFECLGGLDFELITRDDAAQLIRTGKI